MAVILEFANVVLRKTSLMENLPGGIDAFVRLPLPNICEDLYLFRVGFMATSEAEGLISRLVDMGFPSESIHRSVSLVEWRVLPYPSWLEVGLVNGSGACWLAGTPPGTEAARPQNLTLWLSGVTPATIFATLRSIGCAWTSQHDLADDVLVGSVSRDVAAVDLRLLIRPDGDIVILLDRLASRRTTAELDIDLFRDLESTFTALGAWSIP